MTPVVEAAVIAAASTTTVAVVGYFVNAWTTSRALRAGRELARDERLWDKRAEVYQEMFTYAAYRLELRKRRLRRFRYEPAFEIAIRDMLDAYDPPPWIAFRGRVTTFASPEVARAFDAAHDADETIWGAWREREDNKALAEADPEAAEPGTLAALTTEIETLAAKADAADQALFKAVRAELHGDVRPSFWARWRMIAGRRAGMQAGQAWASVPGPDGATAPVPRSRREEAR